MTMIEQSGKEAIEMIVEHARPFYGRPAWSIRYLEHVNAVLPADSLNSLSASALQEKMAKAADDAMKEVKGDLKNRLHQLHDQGLEKLMEDLCRVVVWSVLVLGNHFARFLANSSGEGSPGPASVLWVETANDGESDGIFSASI